MGTPKKSTPVYFDGSFLNNKTGIGRDAGNLLVASRMAFGDAVQIVYPKFKIWSGSTFSSKKPQNEIVRKFFLIWVILSRKPIKVKVPAGSIYIQSHLYGVQPVGTSIKSIVRLHDVFPITNPNWFRKLPRNIFIISINSAILESYFICDSNSTKNEFVKLFPNVKLRSLVAHCPVQVPQTKPCQKCSLCLNYPNLNLNFVITIGTLEPRKNYVALLRAWKEFKRFDASNKTLIVVGKFGWKFKKIKTVLADSIRDQSVLHYPDACDGSMIKLIKSAKAYISASLNEGFNLPAAEAAILGKKLLLSNISIHRELYSEDVLFFNPLSITSIKNSFKKLFYSEHTSHQISNNLSYKELLGKLTEALQIIGK